MRILLTNIGIANRTGSEIVVMDLARGLAAEGHAPMIWTPLLIPDVAEDVVGLGIPVVTRLEDLPAEPDVIHGQHHLETVQAVRHFPDVPAVFVCHDGNAWHDAPPRHASIVRYVGVDEFCRERLTAEDWIPEERISVIPNAVDLDRYRQRGPLPARPRRALIFSNYSSLSAHIRAIQAACGRLDIQLDVIGAGAGNQCVRPEDVLPDYDIVFAKARCALEAMAVGCAVVLCDRAGLGAMVTARNVAEFRRWNFGFRLLTRVPDLEAIAGEIECYNARDAEHVSAVVRSCASLTDAVQHYVSIYRRAELEGAQAVGADFYPATEPIQLADQALLSLRIVDAPAVCLPGQRFTISVEVDNQTAFTIATSPPWHALLTYRWMDAGTGAWVVEEGPRAILQPPSAPVTRSRYLMKAAAPESPGDYVLRVTIFQEGWRWLDQLQPCVRGEAVVSVAVEGMVDADQ